MNDRQTDLPTLSLVVATKDRPEDIRILLKSMVAQTVPPSEIVIVDSSSTPQPELESEFPTLKIKYIEHQPPSAAQQRNVGVANVSEEINLIGFVDDDTKFPETSIETMMRFWATASDDVGGASFNYMNQEPMHFRALKMMSWVDKLSIYPRKPGRVAKSGWHSLIGVVDENTEVEWLPSGASVWRKHVFLEHQFDEYFTSYSYLEDLDFSYSIGKTHKLIVIADAPFYHYPGTGGRVSLTQFGKVEVKNRLYLVSKHRLSVGRCLSAMFLRFCITLFEGITSFNKQSFQRAWGNVLGLFGSK